MKYLEISIPLKTHHLRNFSTFKNHFLCVKCFRKVSQGVLWVKRNQKHIYNMYVRPKRKFVVTSENHDFTQNLPPPRSHRDEKVSILIDLKGCKISFLISVDLTPLWYPECSTCDLPQNRTGMHFFQKMLKIETYMSPMQNPILGIENPCLGPLFKHISFFKKFLSQNLDFWILDFYAIFWLASEVAKYDFLRRAVGL